MHRASVALTSAIVLAAAFAGLAPQAAFAQATSAPPVGVPVPNLSLDQARQAPPGQIVRVVGFVVGSYLCPPCPPGATCKPCAADSEVFVAVAPDHPRVVLFDPGSDVLALAVDDPTAFALGRQYRFELTTADRLTDGVDGRLIRSQRPDDPVWPDASTERPGVVPGKS
jgi:hypothetical protein